MFKFNTGKNPKWKYYLRNYALLLVPKVFLVLWKNQLLKNVHLRQDYDYIQERVNYYNQLSENQKLNAPIPIQSFKKSKVKEGSVYFFDTVHYVKCFPSHFSFASKFGDVTTVPSQASLVKSRPISTNNQNSIMLKLDKVRHFIFVNDSVKFQQKKDMVLFRGKIAEKQNRIDFFHQYFEDPLCDLGMIDKHLDEVPQEWKVPKMTIPEHLNYKFILALEGIDVASNLKWIMSSNSIAVMPKPTCETWFMEAKLIPDHHYIEIKNDFSDLPEKIAYFLSQPERCQEMIKNANAYVAQFKNKKREHIISLLVLEKYFKYTNYSS